MSRKSVRKTALAVSVGLGVLALGATAQAQTFKPGELMISVYGVGGTYADNSATPVTLQSISLGGIVNGQINGSSSASVRNQMVLPQTASGENNPFSGELGSSSEGILQRSTDGRFLTIAGYGVNAAAYNANPLGVGGGATKTCIGAPGGTCYPLGQASAAKVQREIAVIGSNGVANTSTTLGATAFTGNNPRSVITNDGTHFWVTGQGAQGNNPSSDQGLYYTTLGSKTSTQIDGNYDARVVNIYKGNLYTSLDTTEGSGVTDTIQRYSGLPTDAAKASGKPNVAGATPVTNQSGKFTVGSTSQLNGLDLAIAGGSKIYLSPEQYFFANDDTLYVADSGNPKGDNNGPKDVNGKKTPQGLSDGGLQKWSLIGDVWTLDYTLSDGLDLVSNTTACDTAVASTGPGGANPCGATGLIGLTGQVVNGNVELFATNSNLGDLDPTYLYGITDVLGDTQASQAADERFIKLLSAAPGTVIRGVSFAPVPEPATWAMMIVGLAGAGGVLRRSRRAAAAAA